MSPFTFRRRKKSTVSDELSNKPNQSGAYEPYFGEKQQKSDRKGSKTNEKPSIRENGEQVLLSFIKNRLGNQAEGLAIRLMNKNPIKDGAAFSYQINQSTEGNFSTHELSIFKYS